MLATCCSSLRVFGCRVCTPWEISSLVKIAPEVDNLPRYWESRPSPPCPTSASQQLATVTKVNLCLPGVTSNDRLHHPDMSTTAVCDQEILWLCFYCDLALNSVQTFNHEWQKTFTVLISRIWGLNVFGIFAWSLTDYRWKGYKYQVSIKLLHCDEILNVRFYSCFSVILFMKSMDEINWSSSAIICIWWLVDESGCCSSLCSSR